MAALRASAAAAGVYEHEFKSFLAYAAAFYGNLGNYTSFGDRKFVPGISARSMGVIVAVSAARAAEPAAVDELWSRVAGPLYDESAGVKQLAMAGEGVTTYYSRGVTAEEALFVQAFLDSKKISAYNTRLFKLNEGACAAAVVVALAARD